jgi:type 1 glutamine amidotransferase
MKRREMLLTAGAAWIGASAFPLRWASGADGGSKKVLYFTRSAGFEHSVVHREGGKLAHSEQVLVDLGKKHGYEVVCSKDGRVFDGDLDQYEAIAFYTSGDLTQPVQGRDEPPMTKRGLARLLEAIAAGKGFVAFHAATDSFHSPPGKPTDYISMLGGEFVTHGNQQEATLKVTSPDFPGLEGLGESLRLLEEWYTQKDFAKDLHVIHVMETAGMQDDCYKRPPFPATWARKHGKGRVFYTALGHREDVWTNETFQKIVIGGFSWVLGHAQFDPVPNIDKVTPKANQLKS